DLPRVISLVPGERLDRGPLQVYPSRVQEGEARGIPRQPLEEGREGDIAVARLGDDLCPMVGVLLGDARAERGEVGLVAIQKQAVRESGLRAHGDERGAVQKKTAWHQVLARSAERVDIDPVPGSCGRGGEAGEVVLKDAELHLGPRSGAAGELAVY